MREDREKTGPTRLAAPGRAAFVHSLHSQSRRYLGGFGSAEVRKQNNILGSLAAFMAASILQSQTRPGEYEKPSRCIYLAVLFTKVH